MDDAPAKDHAPPAAKPMNAAEADFSFYTWSTFFNALLGRAEPVALKNYFAARDIVREEADCKRCEENRDWMFKNSMTTPRWSFSAAL
jgi:inner membrane protease ATP23